VIVLRVILFSAVLMFTPAGSATAQESAKLRIVSLSPALTAMICEIGKADLLVGVTRYCKVPDTIRRQPQQVGGAADPEVERVVALQPDLILASPLLSVNVESRFHELGFSVKRFRQDTLNDIIEQVQWLGELTGAAELARKKCDEAQRVLKAKSEPLPEGERSAVLIFSDQFQLVAGDQTYGNEVMRLVGLENVAATLHQPWPTISQEWLLAQNPAWILMATPLAKEKMSDYTAQSLQQWRKDPILSRLRAVRDGRVLTLPANQMGIPSLRVFQAIETLRAQLQQQLAGVGQ
jgi:iron complex transport system substrate-binding protein